MKPKMQTRDFLSGPSRATELRDRLKACGPLINYKKKYITAGPRSWCSKSVEDYDTKCFSLNRHLMQIHDELQNPSRSESLML